MDFNLAEFLALCYSHYYLCQRSCLAGASGKNLAGVRLRKIKIAPKHFDFTLRKVADGTIT
jgi:hypothetical protein